MEAALTSRLKHLSGILSGRRVMLAAATLGAVLHAGAAAAAAAGAASAAAAGEEPPKTRYEAQVSPLMDAEAGARDLASLVTTLGAGEERLFRTFDAGGPAWRATGSALRSARTFLWDAPVAWWFGIALHEGFGHGGRGREFHTSPDAHLGSPWGGRDSYASFETGGKSTEELLYIYVGGTEANTLAATLLERRAVEGVRLRPIDLLFLASNRLVASDYVLRTTPDPVREPGRFYGEFSGGGDVARYLGYLHEMHGDGSGIAPQGVDGAVQREYRRLRRQAWWSLADPGLWWSLGSALRLAARGDGAPTLPLPRAGRHRFLPILSAEWTPAGGQASLEWAMAPLALSSGRGPTRLSLVARRGRGPSGGFGALGAGAEDMIPAGSLTFGGTVEVWHDPLHGPGGGARLRARLRRGPCAGLYVDLGLKSQGYWIGQPASAGAYGAVGLVLGN